MSRYVLDANAILAFFLDEPGKDMVRRLLIEADTAKSILSFSLINYGECVYTIERRYGWKAAIELKMFLDSLPLNFYEVDRRRMLAAAHIKARYPLSYADAFAVALAQELDATVVTSDPEFHAVEHLVNVLWLEEPL